MEQDRPIRTLTRNAPTQCVTRRHSGYVPLRRPTGQAKFFGDAPSFNFSTPPCATIPKERTNVLNREWGNDTMFPLRRDYAPARTGETCALCRGRDDVGIFQAFIVELTEYSTMASMVGALHIHTAYKCLEERSVSICRHCEHRRLSVLRFRSMVCIAVGYIFYLAGCADGASFLLGFACAFGVAALVNVSLLIETWLYGPGGELAADWLRTDLGIEPSYEIGSKDVLKDRFWRKKQKEQVSIALYRQRRASKASAVNDSR